MKKGKIKELVPFDTELTGSLRIGVISLVFLIIGFDAALFLHRAAVLRIVANRDVPDTVFITKYVGGGGPAGVAGGAAGGHSATYAEGGTTVQRKEGRHSAEAQKVRESVPAKVAEEFRFDPNTATKTDLIRLGFTPAQAESICSYRAKGGRFRRKSDFGRSYVVSEDTYRRLEPYIDIPLLDINTADSAAFDALPGIGGYFAAKMVAHRTELGGYTCKEQILDIWKMDREKYAVFEDLITVREPYRYPLWSLPADSLRLHPYIRSWNLAHAIVLYRNNTPRSAWRVDSLLSAGVLSEEQAVRLRRLEE